MVASEAIEELENEFHSLISSLDDLKRAAAHACTARQAKIQSLKAQLADAQKTLSELGTAVREKDFQQSVIHEEQLSALISSEIEGPESQLKFFWDRLRLRLEPLGGQGGGVKVYLGFAPEEQLPELGFVLRFQDQIYQVGACDPLVIGLSELVDQLNNDRQSGALARFLCRIRSRYTAQYSTQLFN